MGKFFLVLACCILFFSADLFAITDEEIFRNFQLTIVNPGARSGAMGGAFIGLADDATAAEANPAGLTILTKPEVSFEYRHSESDADLLNSFNFIQSDIAGLTIGSENTIEDLDQPSWLSVSYPIGRTTISFSRQEVSRTEGGIDEVFLLDPPGPALQLFGTTATQDLKVVNYNFSFGVKLSDHFSVGATGRYATLDWQASVVNLSIDPLTNQAFLLFETDLDDDDNAFAWNAGVLYTGTYFSAGAVYKKNAKFEVEETESGPVAGFPGTFTNTLNIPDTFGVGVAVKPNDNLTIVADFVHLENSDLLDNLSVGRNILTSGFTSDDIVYTIEDSWDFHVGTEFVVFVGKIPVALRAGYYQRSPSSLIVESTPGLNEFGNDVLTAVFAERESENHFTVGNGFVFSQHFQIDWALDLANLTDQFILSTVVRF